MIVSAGQGALIQGMRRIADLAKMNTFGALRPLCSVFPWYICFEKKVSSLHLIVVAAMTFWRSWWFSRKVQIKPWRLALQLCWGETSILLKLGFAFMSSSLMTMGVAYVVRLTLLRKCRF